MATALYRLAETRGVKAQNAEFLATDLAAGTQTAKCLNLIIEIIISAGTTPNIEISFDSGATWATIISSLVLEAHTRVKVMATSTDLINFRTPTIGGLTLSRFVVTGDLDA